MPAPEEMFHECLILCMHLKEPLKGKGSSQIDRYCEAWYDGIHRQNGITILEKWWTKGVEINKLYYCRQH